MRGHTRERNNSAFIPHFLPLGGEEEKFGTVIENLIWNTSGYDGNTCTYREGRASTQRICKVRVGRPQGVGPFATSLRLPDPILVIQYIVYCDTITCCHRRKKNRYVYPSFIYQETGAFRRKALDVSPENANTNK